MYGKGCNEIGANLSWVRGGWVSDYALRDGVWDCVNTKWCKDLRKRKETARC